MNATEANTLTRELFASRTRTPTEEIADRYIETILDASKECAGCIRETVHRLCRGGPTGVPTEPQLWEAFRSWMNTGSHLSHIGRSESDDILSRAEGFWRGKAAHTVTAAAGIPPLLGQFCAAKMWASGALPMDLEVIAADAVSGPWVPTSPPLVSPTLVQFAFDYAKAVAETPLAEWSDGRFEGWCQNWSTILQEHRQPAGQHEPDGVT